MKNVITNDTEGAYEIITASGTYLLLDMDTKEALRLTGVEETRPGFFINTEGFIKGWWTGISLNGEVKVGQKVYLNCDAPQNWYLSTPVVSITKVTSPFYGRE